MEYIKQEKSQELQFLFAHDFERNPAYIVELPALGALSGVYQPFHLYDCWNHSCQLRRPLHLQVDEGE